MTAKALLLGLLIVAVYADPEKTSGLPRKPSCPDTESLACPMNYVPVCGTDNKEYGNECALCAERHTTKVDILIAKDGPCQPV